MTAASDTPLRLHASSVALDGRAVLIQGPSGSGKSALALQLLSLGCTLVSDDWTLVSVQDEALWATAPDAIKGKVEARGVGILAAETTTRARVALVVDLTHDEHQRLPPRRTFGIGGLSVPCVHKVVGAHFPAAILQYLRSGRIA